MIIIGFIAGIAATVVFNRYAKDRVVAKINSWLASIGAP
jgi:hypothetical protein